MENRANKIARLLLQSKSIILNPSSPFTWASGWKSPIYCDNRKTLSFPEVRNEIRDAFVAEIKEKYAETEVIAGVATGAIAIGVLVAQELNLPFVYVRSSAKQHGTENLVEGVVNPRQKVLVIEDLVSTGGSSLKAVKALQTLDANVLGMLAIFTYGFDVSVNAFKEANVKLDTLSNYSILLDEALTSDTIACEQLDVLDAWRSSPSKWSPS
jgi:orotate phosphoribosyltransferase